MTEALYTARDVGRILELNESRVLYWARTGVVGPSVKRGGKQLYSFQDLISVKAAKELLGSGLSLQTVRKSLQALRAALPEVQQPLARLRVVSDGERVIVATDSAAFEPLSGQLVMDFAVAALSDRAAQLMELPLRGGTPIESAGREAAERTAYGWFLEGLALDEAGDAERAGVAFRRAVAIDPRLAAAHNNLGSLAFAAGRTDEARAAWEQALALDPEQPEARYNLGNLLDAQGDGEAAITEWSRVVGFAPEFADAHWNLGAALHQQGDSDRARLHLERYLSLHAGSDEEGAWADRARALLAAGQE